LCQTFYGELLEQDQGRPKLLRSVGGITTGGFAFERRRSSRIALAHALLPANEQPHLALVLCRLRADANEHATVVWRRDYVDRQAAEIANERRRLAV
jgi:hypothetical protein